ncbi:hypothetical protein HK102_013269 [Quaeritorhiza haematococci]|nr:hypothetical protein HK102_013269 [Quaeritorhiza haematococci]
MNETGMKMQLRIAPELDLKRLVIGGIDKVYEIGKQFRNEGIDATHNPEFTTCELYQSYSNLDELMKMTETFLSGVARQVSGSPIIEYPSNVTDADKQEQKPLSIDFSPPFARIDVLPALEDALGEVLPDLNDTAKERKGSKGVAERFELFVAGKELINAYDELNDPFEQRSRFAQQLKNRHSGDEDVPLPDEEFCRALEYGLPPTVGWGLGIDRLCMLLTGAAKIREVITFPVLKPIRPSTDGAPTTLIANSQIIESHEE